MTDEHDDPLVQRATAVLRAPGARDDDALAELLVTLRRRAGASDARSDAANARERFSLPRRRPRHPVLSRSAVRFAAGLAAGIAFAAGLGIGLLAGWRMRGESYRLAAQDVKAAVLPSAPMSASAAPVLHPVQFMLVAPSATRVALVGEFNDWDASATPMARAPGGAWHVALPLSSGRHVYAFVVDGSAWVADPQAPLAPERWFGAQNSVLLVNGERRQ